ncbi:hypothetical protein CABS03_13864 [Colletotrichum abscissum]|uniref:Uncharacterized protein n=1 Tax=Colletotrichum abscissum TaxID=1671311 RepID=A0A9P9XGM5_9PEZI|nr:hypothetical protein CABS02_06159 [Colletotrichum abscissum]
MGRILSTEAGNNIGQIGRPIRAATTRLQGQASAHGD